MDDCTPLQGRDYYKDAGSNWMDPFIWGLVILYIAIVILVMLLIASYNKHRRAKLFAHGGDSKSLKRIPGNDICTNEGEVIVCFEEKAGLKGQSENASHFMLEVLSIVKLTSNIRQVSPPSSGLAGTLCILL